MYLALLDGALTTAPLSDSTRRILDVGAGPGDWAIAMANEYPDAEVVAVDLAVWDIEATEAAYAGGGGQVTWELDDLDIWGPMYSQEELEMETLSQDLDLLKFNDPPTVIKYAVDSAQSDEGVGKEEKHTSYRMSATDLRSPSVTLDTATTSRSPSPQAGWNFSEPFDFIHLRGMRGAFADWPQVYAEVYKNLVPGGWIEVSDFVFNSPKVTSSVARAPVSETQRLFSGLRAGAQKSGYPLSTDHMDVERFLEAGFDEISFKDVDVPCGLEFFPDDEHLKRVGKMWVVVMAESTESFCLRHLTKELGWTAEEVRQSCETCRKELFEGKLGNLITRFRFVRARKPLR